MRSFSVIGLPTLASLSATNHLRNTDQTRILTIISNSAEEKVAESFLNQPVSKLKRSFLEILSRFFRVLFCHETLWINLGDTVIELKFKSSKFEVSSLELMADEDGIPHPVNYQSDGVAYSSAPKSSVLGVDVHIFRTTR
ncbi:hypothetical protein WN943_027306 [Citrus x changshan-huyou]